MKNDTCLLLTSAIKVQNRKLVKRNTTRDRLIDYKGALKRWLTKQKSLSNIVFVDNSGYPLDELKKVVANHNLFNKKVEFLSFLYTPKNDVNISLGELAIIDFALKNSKFLKSCKNFIKVTGRLYIANIDRLVKNLPDEFHMVSLLSENLSYVDSAIVIFNKEFYKKKINKYSITTVREAGDKKVDFERAYAKALHRALADDFRWYPFFEQPIIIGISGTKNIPYRNRYWRALKMTLAARLYNFYYRNSYSKYGRHKHLFERWNIKPKW